MAREEELVQKAKEVRENLIEMAKDEINATHIEVGEITAKDDARSLLTIMVGGANRLVPYQGHDTSEFTVGEFWTVIFFDDYGTIKLGWWVAAAGGGGTIPFRPHDLLNGTAHPDTVAQAVTRGSIIVGDSTPEWNELVIGAAARYLRSDGADPAWAQPPGSEITNTPAGTIAATDVQAAINELDTEKAPTHNLLDGTWHPDTVAQAATRGSVIVGDSTPEWNELVIGAAARYLRSDGADPAWAQIPGSEVVNTPAGTIAATDIQAAINELDTEKAPTHDLLDGTWHPDTVAQAVTRGSLIYGDGTPEWNELPIGAAGRVLTSDGTDLSWAVNPGGNHNLLDGTVHPDTVAQAVTRGSLIVGDSTPDWNELVIGAANRILLSDGTDAAWGQADHGAALVGLLDDDHTIYFLADCTRAFGGDPIPDGADTRSLGSAAAEWLNFYIGDAGKIYLGLDQSVSLEHAGAGLLQITGNVGVGTGTPSEAVEVLGRVSAIGNPAWHAPVSEGFFYHLNVHGATITGKGSSYDIALISSAGGAALVVLTGTSNIEMGGALDVTGCVTDGTCEIMKDEDALSIIRDILNLGDGTLNEYGHEHMDMGRIWQKYPFLIHRRDDDAGVKYFDRLGSKSDLLYMAALQLAKRVEELEARLPA